ncbi:dienelactone hydrolase family protein [Aerococcaceae bacterium NML210727]|nr:dienelactone hydrolase family protein [Aerococcaceae bacterium NML210727]MCW6654225.1 dienelactone hydrolase family protein [Aerococcaceae bacterium NML201296]
MKPLVIIYHSVLGIRGSEKNLADLIRKEGFDVVIPDFYEGKVFNDYDLAMRHLGTFGEEGLEQKAFAMFEENKKINGDRPVIFIGFSNGCNIAEWMSLKNAETVGTILFHGGLPTKIFGFEEWPSKLPVQIYYSKKDPWRLEDQEFLQEYLDQLKKSRTKVDFYDYEGEGHLFTDPELPKEYNEEASRDAYKHIKEFLINYR